MRATPAVPDEERHYYLDTFVGRTVIFAPLTDGAVAECRDVAGELHRHGASVILVEPGASGEAISGDDVTAVWRELSHRRTATLTRSDVRAAAEALAAAGRVHKLVLVGAGLVLRDRGGERRSFVDIASAGLPGPLMDAAAPLYRGVEGVNLCEPGHVTAELLTYEGSGTLLTLGDYGEVRPLGFDDYASVAALLRRGSTLGYLRPREPAEIEAVLPRALGFFVAGKSPAGVVALETDRYAGSGFGELESLFTISRFHGEGVGRRLVEALDDRAHEHDISRVFAVTTNDDAARFFGTCGYVEVGDADVPPAKWVGYPAERRGTARCFVREL